VKKIQVLKYWIFSFEDEDFDVLYGGFMALASNISETSYLSQSHVLLCLHLYPELFLNPSSVSWRHP
jgi:hypothetical protein